MQELVRNDTVRIGQCGSVFALCYEGVLTAATVKLLDEVLVKRFDAAPEAHWALLVVIDATIPPPDQAARAAMAALMKGRGTRVSAMAYVVVGSGFQAGAVRAVLVGLSLVSRAEYPMKVFRQPAEAVEWISGRAPQVLKAIDVARTRLEVERFVQSLAKP